MLHLNQTSVPESLNMMRQRLLTCTAAFCYAAHRQRFTLDIEGIPVPGQYLKVETPKGVVVSWGHAGSDTLPPASTEVEFTLTARSHG